MDVMLEVGINTLCPDAPSADEWFYWMCDRKGLIVWQETEQETNIVPFTGIDGAGPVSYTHLLSTAQSAPDTMG